MRGEVWQLGRHRIVGGDAREVGPIGDVFGGKIAGSVITDPPCNVRIEGHVGERGKAKHSEFAFASGEMSDAEFRDFLTSSLRVMVDCMCPGGLLKVFMDWRHIDVVLSVGRDLGLTLKNIRVLNNTTPGQAVDQLSRLKANASMNLT